MLSRLHIIMLYDMVDSLRPHGVQPARLLCPWNFPGKNTGVGCHFLIQDLSNPVIEPVSLVSPVLAGGFFTTSTTWEVTLNSGILQIDALLHFLTTMEIFIEIGASVC